MGGWLDEMKIRLTQFNCYCNCLLELSMAINGRVVIIAENIWYLEERIVRQGNHKGQPGRDINTLITTIGKGREGVAAALSELG